MSPPDLSIVVVTHNGREKALDTLESLRANLGAITAELLVVDSGSSDGTPDAIAARYGDEITLFRTSNVGFAAGNNVALSHTKGRYVLLCNPDVEVVRGTLEELVAALDRRSRVGAASVVQVDSEGRLLRSMRRFPTPLRKLGEATLACRLPGLRGLQETVRDEALYGAEQRCDWVVGAFVAVRREALAQVGPLDDRFFLYSEEVDWCYRIRRARWEIAHLPRMEVIHHCGSADNPRLTAQIAHSRLVYADKHFARSGRVAFRAAALLGHLLRVGLLPLLAPFRPRARSRLAAELWALRVAVRLEPAPLGPVTKSLEEPA